MNNVLIILGVVLLVIGIFAYTYTTTVTQNIAGVSEDITQHPYRYWSYYVIVIGIIILIVGLALPSKSDEYMAMP